MGVEEVDVAVWLWSRLWSHSRCQCAKCYENDDVPVWGLVAVENREPQVRFHGL